MKLHRAASIFSSVILLSTTLTSCYKNGRDANETHQIVAEPKTRWIHWEQEEPVDVTKERVISSSRCQGIP